MLEQVRKEAHAAAQQICEAAKLRQGQAHGIIGFDVAGGGLFHQ